MKLIKTIISNVSLISFISLISFVSLVSSCSKSDDFDGGQDLSAAGGVEIGGVRGYSTYFEEDDTRATRAGGDFTRAWEIPTGYVPYDDGYQPIAIAFTQNGKEPMKGHFFKVDDKWRTNVAEIKEENYYLYGFIPNLPVIKYEITDIHPSVDDVGEGDDDNDGETDIKHDGYSLGAIMTLKDVPTVISQDFCVVIGAKEGPDKEHDNGLRQGDFEYEAKAITEVDGKKVDGGNYVFLLFDHLYAALRVRMRVHDDYAALRTIKLKSLMLTTKVPKEEGEEGEEEPTTDKTDITIKLSANDGSASPIKELNFTPDGGEIEGGLEFWSSTYGEQLTNDFKPFIGHFMPSGITKLILTSTYDVYDKNNKNLIRQNCKVTNSVLLSELFTGQTKTERGKRYTINMTIQPTYLYMLSEPDLDNPTVVVN